MKHENTLYYYERTRKRQAITLAMNMVVLPVIFWLFLILTRENEQVYQQLLTILKPLLIVIELIFISVIIWFLTHPARFFIRVTESEFSVSHPLFKEWTFSVEPQAIAEIAVTSNRQSRSVTTSVKMKDGSSYTVCPNYAYSRKKLYDALRQANPAIKAPKNG